MWHGDDTSGNVGRHGARPPGRVPGRVAELHCSSTPGYASAMALRPLPSFRAPQLQQAIRRASALAFALYTLFGIPEAYWSLITVIVVMQPDLSRTLPAGRDRVLATLLGAALGLGLIALRQAGLPTLPLFLAGLVPLACITAVWPAMRLSCTTLVIVLLIPQINYTGRQFWQLVPPAPSARP